MRGKIQADADDTDVTGHVDNAEFADQAELADHTDVADHTSLTGQVDHADQAELSFHRRIKMRESLLQQKFKLDSRLKLRQCNRFNVIHCSVDPGLSLFWQYSFNRIIYLASR